MIRLENVTQKFNIGTIDEKTVLENFCIDIDEGEFVSVIGSNGSGKSTFLNLVCGNLIPTDGNIIFDGKVINKMPEHKRATFIGRVFQDPKMGTCPRLTILENLALADNKNKCFGLGRCINKKRTDYYRELLMQCEMGLEDRMNACVGTLSGGQRQALALVIANMADIKLLVLDEHTAALDPKSSETIMKLTDKMVRNKGITTLMVTHNLKFATKYGTRLIMMHEGNCILDVNGEQKKNINVDEVLNRFYQISIETGN